MTGRRMMADTCRLTALERARGEGTYMLLTTAEPPSNWVSLKECRNDEWGVWDEAVLTSDWPYTHETRGEVWGRALTTAGSWAWSKSNGEGPVVKDGGDGLD